MKVQVVYRNYIPLYSGYCSFWLKPIKNVEVVIPKVKKRKLMFKIYRLFKGLPFFSLLINFGQKIFFKESADIEENDLLFYTGMLPQKDLNIPYVIDFEHIYSLFDYSIVNRITKQKVWHYLSSKKCIGILPWSIAAQNTLKGLFKEKYPKIENKMEVLYPALPVYKEIYKGEENYECVSKNNSVKFLFIGRDYLRKGLIELLEVFNLLKKDYKDIELYIVSNMGVDEIKKYESQNIHFFDAKYSQEETIKKFFLTCDVFVMPTHADTFGMVLLEALSSGIPVITTNQFAAKEIIDNEVNGLLVKSSNLFLDQTLIPDKKHTGEGYSGIEKELVDDLFLKMKYLLDHPQKLILMKKNAVKQFKNRGKFSIELRNRKLIEIYNRIEKN